MRLVVAGAVLVALAGFAAIAGPAALERAPIGDRKAAARTMSSVPPPIAFASDRDGIDGIYVVDADGTHLRRLIPVATEPRWSPDGSHVAFRRGDNDALFVADARGHGIRRLVASYDEYAWAPHGTRLVSEAQGGLVVIRLDGRRTRLTRGPDVAPSWSPDGKLIAFVRRQGETGALVVIEAEGGLERQLAKGAAAVRPAWSPDSSQLAYVQSLRPVVIDVATLQQGPLLDVRFDEFSVDDVALAWSPDAARIAVGYDGGAIVVPVGGDPGRVIRNGWYPPTWSPDGRLLAGSDETDVVVTRIAGRTTRAPTGAGSGTRAASRTGTRARTEPRSAARQSPRASRPTRGR